MRTATPLPLVLLLLVPGPNAGGEEPGNDRDPWNGFGVGSWVVRAESFTRGDKTESGREKWTRGEGVRPGEIRLMRRKEGKRPGEFDGGEATSWHIPGYDPALDPKCKPLGTGKEELTIGGKKFACVVRKYDLTRGEDKATAAFWHCEGVDVPYREVAGPPRTLAVRPDVLRVDVEYLGKAASQKVSVRVVDFRDERKVGGRKVVCVREEGEIELSEAGKKGKGTITVLLSNEVPGREVESVAEGEVGGVKFRKATRVEAFEVVKGK